MPKNNIIRIGIDCNIIGSVLLGGLTRTRFIDLLNFGDKIQLFYCEELTFEIHKLAKVEYFKHKGVTEETISEFVRFYESISKKIKLNSTFELNRDKKDNYLLNLCFDSQLDYLITGDKDLLVMQQFLDTKIVTLPIFLKEME